jgi:hypothetical protein
MDLQPEDDPLPSLHAPDARGVVGISAVARRGLDELKERLWELVSEIKTHDPEADPVIP